MNKERPIETKQKNQPLKMKSHNAIFEVLFSFSWNCLLFFIYQNLLVMYSKEELVTPFEVDVKVRYIHMA